MSRLYHAGMVLGLGALLFGALADDALGVPVIHVENPIVDLGEIKEGADAEHTFKIENRGDEALEIKSLKSSCGCTVVGGLRPEQKIIPPGESIDIPVKFKSKGKAGKVINRVTIKSNDPKKPTMDVRMTVTVDVLYICSPKLLYIQRGRRGETAPRFVTILPGKKNQTLELLELKGKSADLSIITEDFKQPALNKAGVRVRLKISESARIGRISDELVGKVRVGEEEAPVKIRVSGEIAGDVTVLPPYITRTLPIKRDVGVGQIHVKANKTANVQVKAAIPRSDALVCEVVEHEAKKDYRIAVNFSPTAPAGPFATVVDVFTDSADMPITSVPVFVNAESLVEVTPPWLHLSTTGEPGDKKLVILTTRAETPLKVEKLQCADKAVAARVLTDVAGKSMVQVEVSLTPEAKGGDHYTLLTIQTNIPGGAHLEIPVLVAGEAEKKEVVGEVPSVAPAIQPTQGG
jgi:hypothetical protein